MSFTTDPSSIVNQLAIALEIPQDATNLHEILSLLLKKYAQVINTKEGGLYTLQEQLNFKQFYTTLDTTIFRNVYRFTFDVVNKNGGPIAPGATVTFPHGIANIKETALIYASCTSSTPASDPGFFSVVYPNARLTTTNVIFTNPTAITISKCSLIAEYMKN